MFFPVNNLLLTIKTKLTVTVLLFLAGGVVVAGLGFVGYRTLLAEPKVISPTAPALGVTQVSNTKPVRIVFSHPVNEVSLRHAIHPALKGAWSLETNWVSARSTLIFTPHESPDLDTRYTVELDGIRSLAGGRSQKYLLSFQTDSPPEFATVSPTNQQTEVMPDAPIIITFNAPLNDSVVVSATLTPEVALDQVKVDGATATFRHAAQFQKGSVYTVTTFLATVKRNYQTKATTVSDEPRQISSTTFTTIAAPGIAAYTPTGAGVEATTPVTITFHQPMDQVSTQAAFSIAPTAAGAYSWPDDRTMVFTPTAALTKGQEYTVTVAASAKAISGFTLDEDLVFSFSTVGAVQVSAWSPGNGANGVDVTTAINVTFNQNVDHPSAEGKFSLTPVVPGTFSWNGNVMTFKPSSSLAHNTSYTVAVGAGVASVVGLDSVSAYSATFTTRNQSIMLNVPAYQQAHVYSCMIAAARSALAYRKVSASESAIISRVGRDTTAWSGTWGGDNGVWGDPNTAIVGPLDNASATSPAGKKTTNVYWGYGSHWGPIAKVLTTYGVGNDIRTGMTVQELAQSITDNNPVIIWWVNGIWPSYEVRWKTPSGTSVRGVNGLHVQVVRGFTGSVDNPVSFTVTDSGYGYPGRTYDVGTFKAKWAWFGNTGIVVK